MHSNAPLMRHNSIHIRPKNFIALFAPLVPPTAPIMRPKFRTVHTSDDYATDPRRARPPPLQTPPLQPPVSPPQHWVPPRPVQEEAGAPTGLHHCSRQSVGRRRRLARLVDGASHRPPHGADVGAVRHIAPPGQTARWPRRAGEKAQRPSCREKIGGTRVKTVATTRRVHDTTGSEEENHNSLHSWPNRPVPVHAMDHHPSWH